MRFMTKSNDKRVKILVNKANERMDSVAFMHEMIKRKAFNGLYTSGIHVSGKYVHSRLLSDQSFIEVKTFKSLNPFTSSNGYTKNDGKTEIYLNTRKFNRSDASIIATLFHEAVHEADNNDKENFYHHGDNSPKGGTAPEVVADIVYLLESGMASEMSSAIKR